MADVYMSHHHSMEVQCVCRHSSAQGKLARDCASDDTTKRSSTALNFVPSKSYFKYSKAVLHVLHF